MSSLNNLLNPETPQELSMRMQKLHPPQESLMHTIEVQIVQESPNQTEPKYYSQSGVTIKPHNPHANCPDSLSCLPDTQGRPQHTLPVILRCAILGSPKRRLTIREIYGAMESKYPYYKSAGPAWKQSVRHHLSLNRLFERQPRPATDPGFGSYWTVNLEAPPGTKRPRKRGRPNANANKEPREELISVAPDPPEGPSPSSTSIIRPEIPAPTSPAPPPPASPPPLTTLRPVDPQSFNRSAVRSTEYDDDDDDDDEEEMDWEESGEGTYISEDDYESEAEMRYQFDPRISLQNSHPRPNSEFRPALSSAQPVASSSVRQISNMPKQGPTLGFTAPTWPAPKPNASQASPPHASPPHNSPPHTSPPRTSPLSTNHLHNNPLHNSTLRAGPSHNNHPQISPVSLHPSGSARVGSLHGAFSSYGTYESQEATIEKLKAELATARKEAVNSSHRMSEELADVEAEAAKTRAALEATEARLQVEIKRRRDIEHSLAEEMRQRKAAEDTLKALQKPQRRQTGQSSSRS